MEGLLEVVLGGMKEGEGALVLSALGWRVPRLLGRPSCDGGLRQYAALVMLSSWRCRSAGKLTSSNEISSERGLFPALFQPPVALALYPEFILPRARNRRVEERTKER